MGISCRCDAPAVVRGDAPAVVRCDAPAVVVRCDATSKSLLPKHTEGGLP